MMNYYRADNCIYNLLYVKFNEDIGIQDSFSYTLQFPSFYTFKNTYFNVNQSILNDINSNIKSNVYNFKKGLIEEEQSVNTDNVKNNLPKSHFKLISNYAVTFNKNHILSTIVNLMAFVDNKGPKYNDLDNYNYDLLTGNELTLKDIFNPSVDYITVITNYVNYKISQNKDLYYQNATITIPEDQAFYLTDDALVIYFGLDEIAPASFGIPKFIMEFSKFAPYINPRIYCTPQNVYTGTMRKSRF